MILSNIYYKKNFNNLYTVRIIDIKKFFYCISIMHLINYHYAQEIRFPINLWMYLISIYLFSLIIIRKRI